MDWFLQGIRIIRESTEKAISKDRIDCTTISLAEIIKSSHNMLNVVT